MYNKTTILTHSMSKIYSLGTKKYFWPRALSQKSDSPIIRKLNELGMEPGIIYETIITSVDRNCNPHSAAMGIILEENEDSVLIKIRAYPSSKTGQNLLINGLGVVNITDPELLIRVALDMPPEIVYVKSSCIGVPRISNAAAWIEFKVINISKKNEIIEFICLPLNVDYFEVKPKPYTRAVYALLEAIIHASKIRAYKELGDLHKVSELQDLINMNLKVVEKVASKSRYELIVNEIKKRYF